MAGVNAYKDGVVARLYKGLQGLVKSRGPSRTSRARAGSSGRPPSRSAVHRYAGPARRARHRLLRAHRCPASRSTAAVITSEQALDAGLGARHASSCSAAA